MFIVSTYVTDNRPLPPSPQFARTSLARAMQEVAALVHIAPENGPWENWTEQFGTHYRAGKHYGYSIHEEKEVA